MLAASSARLSSGPTNASPSSPVVDPLAREHAARELDARLLVDSTPDRLSTSISITAIGRPGLLGMPLVGLDDPLHELVPHDVLVAEVHELDAVDRRSRMLCTWISPDACSRGRSICVTSPVTTTFEPKPSRVRNICICSGEVFCASSRMMKLSLSVLCVTRKSSVTYSESAAATGDADGLRLADRLDRTR